MKTLLEGPMQKMGRVPRGWGNVGTTLFRAKNPSLSGHFQASSLHDKKVAEWEGM